MTLLMLIVGFMILGVSIASSVVAVNEPFQGVVEPTKPWLAYCKKKKCALIGVYFQKIQI
jgi:hypothetical protein